MFILLTGGSGSGKSACAEDYALRLSGGKKRYYIATMQIYDEEGAERVRRHREQRADKGFVTIEQPVSVAKALKKMNLSEEKSCTGTALLECVSNSAVPEINRELASMADEVAEVVVGIPVWRKKRGNEICV